jgi:hypothetical protein
MAEAEQGQHPKSDIDPDVWEDPVIVDPVVNALGALGITDDTTNFSDNLPLLPSINVPDKPLPMVALNINEDFDDAAPSCP